MVQEACCTQLKNGVVLAELGGYGDGPYCARHGAGAALVMLGTYIVDPGTDVPYPAHFVFKPGRAQYAAYLQEHVQQARQSNALVGVSVVSTRLADSLDFLAAAEEAGADFISLCAHSTMEVFVSTDTSSALCLRKNWPALRKWASTIADATRAPAIFKLGIDDTPDTLGAVDILIESGVPIIHVNVGSVTEDAARPECDREAGGERCLADRRRWREERGRRRAGSRGWRRCGGHWRGRHERRRSVPAHSRPYSFPFLVNRDGGAPKGRIAYSVNSSKG